MTFSYFSQVRFWNTQKSMCVGQFLAHEHGEYWALDPPENFEESRCLWTRTAEFFLTLQKIVCDHVNFQLIMQSSV